MTGSTRIVLPMSGRMLIAQLAGYGLTAVLAEAGGAVRFSHRPDSLECECVVTSALSVAEIAECVRRSAELCESVVEADLVPGATGNDRRSVIWARNTSAARAPEALTRREALLDVTEAAGSELAASLVAGLGVPSPWIDGKPHRGASALDGVPGNHTSDFVRGVLRKVRPIAASVTDDELNALWLGTDPPPAGDEDKTGWAPRGTPVHAVHQWLAAVGLSMLPVGLSARDRARTPCVAIRSGDRFARVPIFRAPVSRPRLRALLERPELRSEEEDVAAAGRLRALGVSEIVDFEWIDRSTSQSVAFSFGRGTLREL